MTTRTLLPRGLTLAPFRVVKHVPAPKPKKRKTK